MNLLALDPALSTGWAVTCRRWGVQKFSKRPWRHPYAHYLDFRGWLVDLVEEFEIEGIAFEAAFSFSSRGGSDTRMQWEGILLATAAELDLPTIGVMPNSLKKYATGNGRAERHEMRSALKEKFGIDLPSDQHDAIAAIWVLSWASQQARAGKLAKDWRGYPANLSAGRWLRCNRCQVPFERGVDCPRCGSLCVRYEA